ncbi:hypothetical protein F383_37586 [Gossypium arboreum]|uniref:Uncharacterized protein n=1 Tax=Gossypium arboreum TaxID=29729 RepID=A0A0B0MFX6_GOSAR|nr:hypothetical protein F383_37586 [Gossypium arboreum]
MPPDMPVS